MNPDLIGRVAIADRYICLLATEVLVNTNNCGVSRVRFQGKSAAVPRATASCPLMDNGDISGSGVREIHVLNAGIYNPAVRGIEGECPR